MLDKSSTKFSNSVCGPKRLIAVEGVEDVMKKTLFAAALAAASLAAGAAVAADLPRGSAPYYNPISPAFTTGAASMPASTSAMSWGKVTNTGPTRAGSSAAAKSAYNWQSGQFVYGVESDLQASGADDTFAGYKFSNPWFGTLRGRAGYAFNNILLYGTLGLAYGDLRGEFAGVDETKTIAGWTGGVGVKSAWRRTGR